MLFLPVVIPWGWGLRWCLLTFFLGCKPGRLLRKQSSSWSELSASGVWRGLQSRIRWTKHASENFFLVRFISKCVLLCPYLMTAFPLKIVTFCLLSHSVSFVTGSRQKIFSLWRAFWSWNLLTSLIGSIGPFCVHWKIEMSWASSAYKSCCGHGACGEPKTWKSLIRTLERNSVLCTATLSGSPI